MKVKLAPDTQAASLRQPVAIAQPDNRAQAAQRRAVQSAVDNSPRQVMQRQQAAPNRTGLPDQLKAGIESMSGHSLDDVQVHYNSSRPAQLQAHAYAQGTAIHVGPGQEQHLPHEAWHVAQQKQGRVRPTTQLKGTAINDDSGLEHEADVMGRRAAAAGVAQAKTAGLMGRGAKSFGRTSTLQLKTPVAQLGKRTKKARKKIAKSKGKLDHKRSTTAYGYFNQKGNTKLQGPHTTAHITTSTALAIGDELGRDMSDIVGSKIAPRPRIANKLLRHNLTQPGGQGLKKTRKKRTNYLKRYSDLYNKIQQETNQKKKNAMIHRLIELSPTGTYALDTGNASASNMAGKGERRTRAAKDLKKLGKMPKGGPLPSGLHTYDGGGTLTGISQSASHDRARQLGEYAADYELSDAEEYGSESDSDVDLDE